jgi:hypothetical protein
MNKINFLIAMIFFKTLKKKPKQPDKLHQQQLTRHEWRNKKLYENNRVEFLHQSTEAALFN